MPNGVTRPLSLCSDGAQRGHTSLELLLLLRSDGWRWGHLRAFSLVLGLGRLQERVRAVSIICPTAGLLPGQPQAPEVAVLRARGRWKVYQPLASCHGNHTASLFVTLAIICSERVMTASPYSRGEGLRSPPPSPDRDHPRTPRHVLKAAQHCSDHVSLRALAGAQVGLRQGLTNSPNLSFRLVW